MTQPYYNSLTLAGEVFEFSHLEPFTMEFESKMAQKWLRLHVTFKNHCFTKGYKPEEHIDGEPIIDEFTSSPRLFCRIRYRLSKALPALIQGLNHPKVEVIQTAAKRNWVYSLTIEDPAGPYHIFLEVRRAAGHQKHLQDLNIVIESAYHEDPEEGPPNVIGPMNFYLLCGKVFTNKPVATKR